MCPQLWVCFTNSDTTLLTYFQPLFITMPHRSFLAPLTHSQLFLLFSIYLLLDLYSAFSPESLRPIKYYTSKVKLKMGKVGKQIGIENLRDNGWLGEREEGCSEQFIFLLLVCHSENLSIVSFFFSPSLWSSIKMLEVISSSKEIGIFYVYRFGWTESTTLSVVYSLLLHRS